jgi:rhodanese-related sulfurtransferase
MKSYLIKTLGILMFAALAGVAHFAMGEKIEFAGELAPVNNSIDGPEHSDPVTVPVENDPTPQDPVHEPENTQDTSVQNNEDDPFVLPPDQRILEREITTNQARYLFEQDLAVFFDARPKDTFEDGHITGAFSLPTDSFDNGEPFSVGILNDDKYIVIYCSGGNCEESHFIAEDISMNRPELANMIHIYVAGYPEWTEAGLPTQSGPDPFAE